MSVRIAENQPVLITEVPDLELDGSPALVFDWRNLGHFFTALSFCVANDTAGPVTVTPEVSPDREHVCTAGIGVPKALEIAAGETSMDPYGVDLMIPFWRLWVTGTGAVKVYVWGIPRTGGRVP